MSNGHLTARPAFRPQPTFTTVPCTIRPSHAVRPVPRPRVVGMSVHHILIGSVLAACLGPTCPSSAGVSSAGVIAAGVGGRPAALMANAATSPILSTGGTRAVPDHDELHWPLSPGPVVIRGFVLGPYPWSPGHRGVDLRADPGQEVLAAASGTVSFAGPVAGREVVSLLHDSGIRTTYEPVHPVVRAGDRVRAGQPLGTVSRGHRADLTCLHWGALLADHYLDPLALMRRADDDRPVLLPWTYPERDDLSHTDRPVGVFSGRIGQFRP
jgi:hypothetical protein